MTRRCCDDDASLCASTVDCASIHKYLHRARDDGDERDHARASETVRSRTCAPRTRAQIDDVVVCEL